MQRPIVGPVVIDGMTITTNNVYVVYLKRVVQGVPEAIEKNRKLISEFSRLPFEKKYSFKKFMEAVGPMELCQCEEPGWVCPHCQGKKKHKCPECNGRGESECHACGQDTECECCDGQRIVDCDCDCPSENCPKEYCSGRVIRIGDKHFYNRCIHDALLNIPPPEIIGLSVVCDKLWIDCPDWQIVIVATTNADVKAVFEL